MQRMERVDYIRDGGASNPTNPNDVEQVNLAQMAGGKNGSLEIQKYLYETGLQNIFNDYNKQIANLDASKQKEIEDAYYVRELSKKYLGEYASNTGVGDVSGQLLDIYGNYQRNMNEINANFNELQTGLESSYSDKKNEYELGLLQTQMNIETAEQQEQLEKDLAEINYNLSLGLYPDGMDAQDYIDSEREKIGETNYWSLMAQNKLVEMNETVNSALKNTNKYKNQGEWDTFVDSLFSNKSINKQQADYLKGMYEVEQNTNFTKNNIVNVDNDITYYNPDNLNIVSKGNVYESRNGDYILAETNNVIDSYSSLYEGLDEVGEDIAFDTPFAYNGKWFVKETKEREQVYTEYVKSNNYNKLTNSETISSSNESQKEMYNEIHKTLKGKDGNFQTPDGVLAYKYNSETKEYTPYLDFKASNVGDEKGDFLIKGVRYTITKNEDIGNNTKDTEIKGNLKADGTWKSGKGKSYNVKDIIKEFTNVYFNGDTKAIYDYVQDSRKGFLGGDNWFNASENTVGNSNAMVIEYQGNYYTINDGELWRLEKK